VRRSRRASLLSSPASAAAGLAAAHHHQLPYVRTSQDQTTPTSPAPAPAPGPLNRNTSPPPAPFLEASAAPVSDPSGRRESMVTAMEASGVRGQVPSNVPQRGQAGGSAGGRTGVVSNALQQQDVGGSSGAVQMPTGSSQGRMQQAAPGSTVSDVQAMVQAAPPSQRPATAQPPAPHVSQAADSGPRPSTAPSQATGRPAVGAVSITTAEDPDPDPVAASKARLVVFLVMNAFKDSSTSSPWYIDPPVLDLHALHAIPSRATPFPTPAGGQWSSQRLVIGHNAMGLVVQQDRPLSTTARTWLQIAHGPPVGLLIPQCHNSCKRDSACIKHLHGLRKRSLTGANDESPARLPPAWPGAVNL
jgi:hypothetical protein